MSDDEHDAIDLNELWLRLARGVPQIIGFAALGLAVAATLYLVASPFLNLSTTARVVFSFDGFEKGLYPDKSKFQPDDLRAPDVIAEALKRQGLDTSELSQSSVRAALTVEGIIPIATVKERDRLRATGQTLPPLIPDEYQITLSLPRKFPLSIGQRKLLLDGILSAYREKFQRTYADVPLAFGNAFDTLKGADYFEYELILSSEIQNITAYLNQQLESAKTFRSQTSNLSFSDLIKKTQIFAQIRLNETLGLIQQNGLSKNRKTALGKIDYDLRTLEDLENKALEEEKVVQDLLKRAQEHGQGYVLGLKTEAAQSRTEAPILDQGLIDSLLAHDSYNFLIREALKAGLKIKSIQSEKAILMERRRNLDAYLQGDSADQSNVVKQVQSSLNEVEVAYKNLISDIRKTQMDFARQKFADAVRVSMQASSESIYGDIIKAGIAGLGVGITLGIGLSLLKSNSKKGSFTAEG